MSLHCFLLSLFFVAPSHSALIFGLVQMDCIRNTEDRAILGAQQGDAVLEVFLQLNCLKFNQFVLNEMTNQRLG